MNFLLDTNILVLYLRDRPLKNLIEDTYHPFDLPNIPIISVVSEGELRALALKNNWGLKSVKVMDNFLRQVVIADINSADVIAMYAEIDAYSQDKLKNKRLGATARNMGKNDLWIAATAAVTGSKLMTTENEVV